MWAQVVNMLLGLWLMAAPGVLGYRGAAGLNDHILGPIAASAACIALWECTRAVRWLNLPIGVWLLLAPWWLGHESVPWLNSTALGLLLTAFSTMRGGQSQRFGGGWRALWGRGEEGDSVGPATQDRLHDLREPVDRDRDDGTRGAFDARARVSRLLLWLTMYRGPVLRAAAAAAAVACAIALVLVRGTWQKEPKMGMTLKSDAFREGWAIPRRHTEDGEDLSPPLTWTDPPSGTKELALIVDDPDAPRAEPWVHWVLYKIPADIRTLTEGMPQDPQPGTPSGAVQGKNAWGTDGYRGPAPPKGHGTHHYHFHLYALDAPLAAAQGLDKAGLLATMRGHVLAEGELMGTYER